MQENTQQTEQTALKKPYEAPEVTVLADVQETENFSGIGVDGFVFS